MQREQLDSDLVDYSWINHIFNIYFLGSRVLFELLSQALQNQTDRQKSVEISLHFHHVRLNLVLFRLVHIW